MLIPGPAETLSTYKVHLNNPQDQQRVNHRLRVADVMYTAISDLRSFLKDFVRAAFGRDTAGELFDVPEGRLLTMDESKVRLLEMEQAKPCSAMISNDLNLVT